MSLNNTGLPGIIAGDAVIPLAIDFDSAGGISCTILYMRDEMYWIVNGIHLYDESGFFLFPSKIFSI